MFFANATTLQNALLNLDARFEALTAVQLEDLRLQVNQWLSINPRWLYGRQSAEETLTQFFRWNPAPEMETSLLTLAAFVLLLEQADVPRAVKKRLDDTALITRLYNDFNAWVLRYPNMSLVSHRTLIEVYCDFERVERMLTTYEYRHWSVESDHEGGWRVEEWRGCASTNPRVFSGTREACLIVQQALATAVGNFMLDNSIYEASV